MAHDPTARRRRPENVPVSGHYQGERGKQYAESVQRNRAAEGAINRDKFAKYVDPGDTVLDFGCANGGLLLALPASERIGIEVNAATRVEAQHAGLQVHESLSSVQDRSVDVAITNHALEHVLAPYDALVELRRVLRSTGRLVVCVPADDWRNAPKWRPGDPNHHVYAWTPLTLGNFLVEAGFAPVSVRIRHRAWPRRYVQLNCCLPRPIWEAVCFIWAFGRRRREIMAVAVPDHRFMSDGIDR